MTLHPSLLSARFILRILLCAVCLRALLLLCEIMLLSPAHLVSLVHDDAYYYLDVARSLGQGQGSVYAGLLTTNGYQPLWQWLLAGISWLLGNARTPLLLTTAVLPVCLLALGQVWLWRTSKASEKMLVTQIIIGTVCTYLVFPFTLGMGMESSLILLVLPVLVYALERRTVSSSALLIFALLPLIRLDALIIPAVHVGLLSLQAGRQRRLISRRELALLVLPLVVLAIYATVNILEFGTWLPISGIVKSVGGAHFSNLPALVQGVTTPVLTIALLFWLLVESLTRGLDKGIHFLHSIQVFLFATLGQALYYGCLSTWPLWPWYAYLAACFSAVAMARVIYLLSLAVSVRSWPSVVVVCTGLLFVLAQTPRTAATTTFLASLRQQWLHADISQLSRVRSEAEHARILDDVYAVIAGKTVAMGDRAGIVAYWRPEQTRFIQTEGLMADLAYHQRRFSGNGEAYLVDHGVDILMTDRDYYQMERTPTGQVFVVPEPTLGSMVTSGAMLFCFPRTAVIREYLVNNETHIRLFDFHRRIACSTDIVRRFGEIERGELGYMKHTLPSLADGGIIDSLGRVGRRFWK